MLKIQGGAIAPSCSPLRTPMIRSLSSSRLDYEATISGQKEEPFLAEDDISTLSVSEIADRLGKETTLPQGFSIKCIDQALYIYIIEVADDAAYPKLKALLQ